MKKYKRKNKVGYKIGYKCGRFELIHRAHIETLLECAGKCDKLIVLIHDCKTKPSYMSAKDRKFILDQLYFVDTVMIYKAETEDDFVAGLVEHNPKWYHIMFHSEELEGKENVPCADFVDEVQFIKRKEGSVGSVGELVEKIKNE